MALSSENYNPNKTTAYFKIASKLLAIGGLPGYIKWLESGYSKPIYKHVQSFLTVCILILITMEVGSFANQKNLSDKQVSDLLVLGFCHPIVTSYQFLITYHQETVKELLYELCISLKSVYNDPDVEREMIQRTTLYSVSFLVNICFAVIAYGYEGAVQAVRTDGTFVTVITAWPDVNDTTALANVARIIGYLVWWVLMARVSAIFFLIIITTGCLCYQYKNLQSYFYSLNEIFDEEDVSETSHESVEEKYEDALKVGIKLHADTLWCTRKCQVAYSVVYSAQIILNVATFSVLMLQMAKSERTLGTTFKIIFSSAALLTSTGILMWNAGNVTMEAALLPTAMYTSGWHNCRGKGSLRVRKLLFVAIIQAQRRVVLRSFGIVDISYQAYVSMVKASYSAFSLLY